MHEMILPALRSALVSASLLRQDASLLVAVSGGADSVALLCALVLLRKEAGYALAACHVEHGLRGEASLQDAAFVQELCRQWDVPLLLHHAHLPGGLEAPGFEDRARSARRAFFRSAMDEVQADALLLAHHRDDQAETVLMRLLRGSGTLGLGGMRPLVPFGRGVLLRPFLSLGRQDLQSALLRSGQSWREDESNASPCCLRNRLRLQAMPLLTACQPSASLHLAQTAERLQWDEDCLGQLAEEPYRASLVAMPACHALCIMPLGNLPKALFLRVLRLWLAHGFLLASGSHREGVPCAPSAASGQRALSFEDTLRLYALANGQGPDSLNLPGGLRVVRTGPYLHLLRQDRQPLLPLPEGPSVSLVPAKTELSLASHRFALQPPGASAPPFGALAVPLAEEALAQGLVLRFPMPGDQIRPFGASGHKALRRYFTDRKVPAPFRATWPVLAQGNQVLWAPGLGAGEATRLPGGAPSPWVLSLQSGLPIP